MFQLTDNEKNKLQNIGEDAVAISALKKFFLDICLKSGTATEELAASRLAIDYLADGFKKLELRKQQEQKPQERNVGL